MTFADLETDAEREIWLVELAALKGSPEAERWAAHAVERHRAAHRPLQPGDIVRRRVARPKAAAGERYLPELVDACLVAAQRDVPALPDGARKRQQKRRRGLVRAYAMCAMRVLVGTTDGSRAMQVTEVGLRGRDKFLRREHPAIAKRAVACAREIQRGQRKEAA